MSARSPLMNVMIKAAEAAARPLRRDAGEVEQLQVSVKGPGDFVSAADRRAEEMIVASLKEARPGFSFLLEEGGEIPGSDPRHRWIIDPLDGTTNFLNGIPHWAISIACEKDGEIIAGLIYNPMTDEIFHAEKGQGAFMRHKRLRVSGTRDLGYAVIGCESSPRLSPKIRQLCHSQMRLLGHHGAAFRQTGSAALNMAYVAAGRFDSFWEYGLQPWDVAAGYIILKEAGGFVSEINGGTNPIFGKSILASNEPLYMDIKKILNENYDATEKKSA